MLLLTDCQRRLYAYAFSFLGDRELTRDVVQETSLILWRRANEFERGTSFTAWALSIAYYQVLAARQKLSRDKLVFNEELMLELHDSLSKDDDDDQRQRALAECLKKLPDRQRELVMLHYAEGRPQKAVAEQLGMSLGNVAMTLHRSRVALMKCIERSVAQWRST